MTGRQRPVQPGEQPRMEGERGNGRDGKRAERYEEASPQLVQMLGKRRLFARGRGGGAALSSRR